MYLFVTQTQNLVSWDQINYNYYIRLDYLYSNYNLLD